MGQTRSGNFSSRVCRSAFLRFRDNSRGQIVVEYVLVLVIVVTVASLVVSRFASRDEANPGILIKKWCEIQALIKNDNPGDRKNPVVSGGCP